jgi:alpha-D-xyloside xylohydrolase
MYSNEDFANVKSKKLYLPQGAVWFDFWTGEKFQGGQSIVKETPIDIIPLYVKAGTILPVGPDVQYATEKKWDTLEIRVFPGADGEFTLYEDEGDNYNYEKGKYSTITFKWNDSKKILTIEDRKGSFPGMLTSRNFQIVKVSTEQEIGLETTDHISKVVKYTGGKKKVVF